MKPANSAWGRFDVRFDSPRKSMAIVAWFMNWRSRLSGIATGDQAIFVDRKMFELAGGFDDIPLMEDVALSRKLKVLCRPLCLPGPVTTSARRWHAKGVIRTVLLMWLFRLAYALGGSPHSLARYYAKVR